MTRHPEIWFVVADGDHARILAHDEDGFTAVTALDSADAHHATRDIGSDKPGRSFESIGAAHHTIAPHSDPKEQAKLDFAHTVAGMVNEGADGGRFEQLVLVAPPKTLQAIKESLGSVAKAHLVAEEPKDLIKLPEAELRERLQSIDRYHRA